MVYKCADCRDSKIYQGLGAPEPCQSCLLSKEFEESPVNKTEDFVEVADALLAAEIFKRHLDVAKQVVRDLGLGQSKPLINHVALVDPTSLKNRQTLVDSSSPTNCRKITDSDIWELIKKAVESGSSLDDLKRQIKTVH